MVINADQGLGVYQSLPGYEVEFIFFPITLSNIIRKKFDSLYSEKKKKNDLDFQLHRWLACRSICNGIYPLMIVTKMDQEEYNIMENCNAIVNVDLNMKKNKLQKFNKDIILVCTTIRKLVMMFLIVIMGKSTWIV